MPLIYFHEEKYFDCYFCHIDVERCRAQGFVRDFLNDYDPIIPPGNFSTPIVIHTHIDILQLVQVVSGAHARANIRSSIEPWSTCLSTYCTGRKRTVDQSAPLDYARKFVFSV